MTLGAWMRDYLYIPLGGSRVRTRRRLYFNLWFVFLVSGLWHGASWNFVLWGAYHGFFLILDRLFLLKVLEKIGKWPATLFTFFVAVMGWVLFRIEDLPTAMLYYKRLFAFDFKAWILPGNASFFFTLLIALFFSFITMFKWGLRLEDKVFYSGYDTKRKIVMFFICGLLLVLSIASVTTSGFNPFIYFRF